MRDPTEVEYMSIAILVGSFPKLSETFILNQIIGLIERGHEVTISAHHDPGESAYHDSIDEYNLWNKAFYTPDYPSKIREIGGILDIILRNGRRNIPEIKRVLFDCDDVGLFRAKPFLESSFDVIHSHFGPVGIEAAQLKRAGVITAPLIASFHGWGIREGLEQGGEMYRNLFETADVLVANSDWTKEKLIEFGAEPDRIRVLGIGIDLERFTYREPSPQTPLKSVGILSVGRLSEEKGHRDGIRTIESLTQSHPGMNIQYRIVGGGDCQAELELQIAEAGLADAVELVGPLPSKGVIEEMQRADILLHPSHSEGFGMVLLEAQATGLPIVATRVGGIPDAVNAPASAKLVPAENIEAMTHQLDALIQNPDTWSDMAKAGREYVSSNYDHQKYLKCLLSIFNEFGQ